MSGPREGAGVRTWDSLARSAAAPRPVSDDVRRELLLLGLGEDLYALPVERVREIVRSRDVTPMPRVPAAVRGVFSLRGEVVQVIDLRRRLGLPPAADAAPRRARIAVLHGSDGKLAGLWVDRVSEVLRVSESEVAPASGSHGDLVEALCSQGDRFVSLLDVDGLLDLGGE